MKITDMYTSSISDASRTFRDHTMSEITFHNILYTLKLSIIYEHYCTINIITHVRKILISCHFDLYILKLSDSNEHIEHVQSQQLLTPHEQIYLLKCTH